MLTFPDSFIKWELKAFAFSLLSAIILPSTLRGCIPLLSFLNFLIKLKNLLGFIKEVPSSGSVIFTNEPDEVLPDKGPSPHPLMEDITITTPGILTLLQNLNIHKASGPDTISTRLLKKTAEVTAPILKLIFEKSLATGEVPYDWRIANMTPFYKKGERCVS